MASRFHGVRGDFLTTPLPRADAIVANVPYQISSPILQRIFTMPVSMQPSRCVLMFQKEFADRMVAK